VDCPTPAPTPALTRAPTPAPTTAPTPAPTAFGTAATTSYGTAATTSYGTAAGNEEWKFGDVSRSPLCTSDDLGLMLRSMTDTCMTTIRTALGADADPEMSVICPCLTATGVSIPSCKPFEGDVDFPMIVQACKSAISDTPAAGTPTPPSVAYTLVGGYYSNDDYLASLTNYVLESKCEELCTSWASTCQSTLALSRSSHQVADPCSKECGGFTFAWPTAANMGDCSLFPPGITALPTSDGYQYYEKQASTSTPATGAKIDSQTLRLDIPVSGAKRLARYKLKLAKGKAAKAL